MNFYQSTIDKNPVLKHEIFLELIKIYQNKKKPLSDRKTAQKKIILANIKLVKKIV
jgi:DNA-directed RNA polymerase sigma subunit (sigma70/sigma32)